MVDEEKTVLYSTASHKGEVSLDDLSKDEESCLYESNRDLAYDFKVLYRYLRKKFKSKFKEKVDLPKASMPEIFSCP